MKHFFLLPLFIYGFISANGQINNSEIDSSCFYKFKEKNPEAHILYIHERYKNGEIKKEEWLVIESVDKIIFPKVKFDSVERFLAVWKYFTRHGRLYQTSNFGCGEDVWADTTYNIFYNKTGEIAEESKTVDYKRIGEPYFQYSPETSFAYFHVKRRTREFTYRLGKKDGEWKWYDKKGNVIKIVKYQNGVKIK